VYDGLFVKDENVKLIQEMLISQGLRCGVISQYLQDCLCDWWQFCCCGGLWFHWL